MRNILNKLFCLVVVCCMIACSGFDDSALKERIDNIKERIAALQLQADNLENQLKDLSYITNGNVVTSVAKNAEGKYVITYKDNANNESTIVLTTTSEMTTVPVIGVAIDNGVYYWTENVKGSTTWLLDKDGQKIPVSNHVPTLGVDANGNWTVDGNLLKDEQGQSVVAHDADTSLFKDVKKDAEGNLVITLGNSSTITLPIIADFNLHLDTTPVVDLKSLDKFSFNYELLGGKASCAIVDIAKAENLSATIYRQTKTVEVTFPKGFRKGNLLVVAYDLAKKTIIRPVYFNRELVLSADTQSFSFDAICQEEKTLNLISPDGDWTADYDAEWITLVTDMGDTKTTVAGAQSDDPVTLFIKPSTNITGKDRSGKITFSDGKKQVVVEVNQSGDLSSIQTGEKGFPVYWRYMEIYQPGGPWTKKCSSNFVKYNYTTTYNGKDAFMTFVRSAENQKVKYIKRTLNATRFYPVIPGSHTDDYYLFAIGVDNLPAGSVIDVFIPVNALKQAPKYFLIEYYEDGEWKQCTEDLMTAVEDPNVKFTGSTTGNSNYARYLSQIIRLNRAYSNENLLIRCRIVGSQTTNDGILSHPGGTLNINSVATQTNSNMCMSDGMGPLFSCFGTAPTPANKKKVLVIGNSFTYYNASAIIMKEIAWTDGIYYFKPNVITRSSQAFANWVGTTSGGLCDDIISWGGYDYAIIQDKSTNPSDYASKGTASISDNCVTLVGRILAASPTCKIMLEETWAFAGSNYSSYGSYDAFDDDLWTGSLKMAQNASVWLSPVGLAFKYVRANYPDINLYAQDSKHPSYEGSYLKACVNYLMIKGGRFTGNVSSGLLSADVAAQLRTAAEKVVIDDYYSHASDYKR